MRNGKACNRGLGLIRASVSAALLCGVAACSGDVIRFTDDIYTASIPNRPRAELGTVSPVATPAQQRAAIAASYPGPKSATLPPVPNPTFSPAPPKGVDMMGTGSIAPSAPVYQGIGQTQQVVSSQLPAPAIKVAPRPSIVPTNPADLVDTSQARQPVRVQAPVGVDNAATGSVPVASGALSGAEGWTRTGGTYVALRSGETIYNLAKRYGVPANAIMEANNITDPAAVGVGQRMLIPVYVYSRTAPVSAPDANAAVRAASSTTGGRTEFGIGKAPLPNVRPQASSAPATVASVPRVTPASKPVPVAAAAQSGRYIVKGGDTLSAISRQTGASVDGIMRVNGMSSSALRVGQSLILPGTNTSAGNAKIAANPGIDPMTTSSVPKKAPTTGYTPPKAADNEVASIDRSDKSVAPSATGVGDMRWPAQGRVITAFKANDGGVPNEGIDISLPVGTPVKAAENGVVIYSGEGLKELGKTVLIRHDNGLVSVYGHADSLNVSRGDAVKRGQVIAASGMTGNARKPKLHFEIRKNTTAVDPMQYLK